MRIASIRLLHFRRFNDLELRDFHSQANIFMGPNAYGKSTLLEALALLTQLESFRTIRSQELIKSGETQASVTVEVMNPLRSRVVVGLDGSRKKIMLDGKAVTSKAKYPLLGGSVHFTPDDLLLLKGGPEARRHFLNELAWGLEPSFAKALHTFEMILRQRNKLLKIMKEGVFSLEEYQLWTDKFIEAAVPIYEQRIHCARLLNETLPEVYENLFQVESEKLSLLYEPALPKELTIADALAEKLLSLREAERAVGHSLAGPHRDDWLLKVNGLEARHYASQGQIRGMVIALKISQLELTRHYRAWSPLLLLDDIVSELDEWRMESLIHYLSAYPGQIFMTTAEISKIRAFQSRIPQLKAYDLSAFSEGKSAHDEGQKQSLIVL